MYELAPGSVEAAVLEYTKADVVWPADSSTGNGPWPEDSAGRAWSWDHCFNYFSATTDPAVSSALRWDTRNGRLRRWGLRRLLGGR